jgi:hypothetical protein
MEQEKRASAAAAPRQASHREFGLVMAGACLLFAAASLWRHRAWLPWASLAALFLLFALFLPRALAPLNAAWSLLGRLLHRVMSPLVLGTLYFGVFTPFGFVFRFVKKDPLRLKRDPAATTYWIRRDPAKQPGQGMTNQF